MIKIKKQFFSYLPITETLKSYISDKSIENDIKLNTQTREDDIFEDFTDGSVYQDNTFFKENSETLKIMLYQDSFEVVNLIGPAKKKHKVLAVYMTLGNIPSHLRNHIHCIKLAALCKEVDFNHEKVYGGILTDLHKIEDEGIEINGKKLRDQLSLQLVIT